MFNKDDIEKYFLAEKQESLLFIITGIVAVLAALKQMEIPRMEMVNRNFVIYRWVELVLLVTGLILSIVYGQNPGRSFWYGFGIALSLQAGIMLAADFFAEKRALKYARGLQSFTREKR